MTHKEETEDQLPIAFYGLRPVLKKHVRLCLFYLAEQAKLPTVIIGTDSGEYNQISDTRPECIQHYTPVLAYTRKPSIY